MVFLSMERAPFFFVSKLVERSFTWKANAAKRRRMDVLDQEWINVLYERLTNEQDVSHVLPPSEFAELCSQLTEKFDPIVKGDRGDLALFKKLLEIIMICTDGSTNEVYFNALNQTTVKLLFSQLSNVLLEKYGHASVENNMGNSNSSSKSSDGLNSSDDTSIGNSSRNGSVDDNRELIFLLCYDLYAFPYIEDQEMKSRLTKLFPIVEGEFENILMKLFLKQQMYKDLIYADNARDLLDLFLKLYNHCEISESESTAFYHWLLKWELAESEEAGFSVLHLSDFQYILDIKIRILYNAFEVPVNADPSLLDSLMEWIQNPMYINEADLYRCNDIEQICKNFLNDNDDSRFKDENDFILWKEKAQNVIDSLLTCKALKCP